MQLCEPHFVHATVDELTDMSDLGPTEEIVYVEFKVGRADNMKRKIERCASMFWVLFRAARSASQMWTPRDLEWDVACYPKSQGDLAVDGSRTDMPRRMSACGWFSSQLDAHATSEPWHGMFSN